MERNKRQSNLKRFVSETKFVTIPVQYTGVDLDSNGDIISYNGFYPNPTKEIKYPTEKLEKFHKELIGKKFKKENPAPPKYEKEPLPENKRFTSLKHLCFERLYETGYIY